MQNVHKKIFLTSCPSQGSTEFQRRQRNEVMKQLKDQLEELEQCAQEVSLTFLPRPEGSRCGVGEILGSLVVSTACWSVQQGIGRL